MKPIAPTHQRAYEELLSAVASLDAPGVRRIPLDALQRILERAYNHYHRPLADNTSAILNRKGHIMRLVDQQQRDLEIGLTQRCADYAQLAATLLHNLSLDRDAVDPAVWQILTGYLDIAVSTSRAMLTQAQHYQNGTLPLDASPPAPPPTPPPHPHQDQATDARTDPP